LETKYSFNGKWIAFVAVFSAMCGVLYFVKMPLPIFPVFLEIHVSDFPALIAGFSMGPLAGAVVCVCKFALEFIDGTKTAGVGELANFLNGIAFVLPSSIIYKRKKDIKGAIIAIIVGGLSSTIIACLANYIILIPFYKKAYGFGAIIGMCSKIFPKINQDNFYGYYIFGSCVPFNLLRVTLVGIITFLVYKPTSKVLNKIYFGSKVEQGVISTSAEQTIAIAKEYAKTLRPNDVVLLGGDLGAGKTTFTKGIALGLGITDSITSPTYAYMNDYNGKLFHFDCYRLTSGEDAEGLGLTDYFYANGICVIEWSENIASVLPENCKRVNITTISKNKRRIEL